jgi:hypothetical protein
MGIVTKTTTHSSKKRHTIRFICSVFVLVLHPEPPCVSQKMGDKRNWSNATGKWVLEKGQLTHIFALSEEFLAGWLDLSMRSLLVFLWRVSEQVLGNLFRRTRLVRQRGVGSGRVADAAQRSAAASGASQVGVELLQRSSAGVGSGSVVLAAAAWLQRRAFLAEHVLCDL